MVLEAGKVEELSQSSDCPQLPRVDSGELNQLIQDLWRIKSYHQDGTVGTYGKPLHEIPGLWTNPYIRGEITPQDYRQPTGEDHSGMLEATQGVTGGSGRRPVNLEHGNVEFQDHNPTIKKVAYKADFEDIDNLHEHEDVAINDTFVNYLNPPYGYIEFMAHMHNLKPFDTDNEFSNLTMQEYESLCRAELMGYNEFECSKTKNKAYSPVIGAIGHLSPYKFHKRTKNSANRLVRNIKNFSNYYGIDYNLALDLTFPKVYFEHLSHDEAINLIKKILNRFIKKYLYPHYGIKENEQLGLYANIHIWSSKNPFEKFYHIHLDFLNCVLKKVDNGYSFKRFKPFHVKKDSAKFKSLWAECLGEFGIDMFNSEDNLPVIYMQNIKIKSAKFAHRVKYKSRKPIVDFANYFNDNSFEPGDLQDHDFTLNVLHYVNRRHVYGFLTRLKNYLPPDLSKYDAVCPICGAGAYKLRYIDKYDFEVLLMEGIIYFEWNKSHRGYDLVKYIERK